MPTLSRWAIKLALIYLVAGWGLGGALMANRAWGWSAGLWRWLEVHIALAIFGWTFLLVVGVAYWMLPTFGGRTNRGHENAAWVSVVATNLGVIATGLEVMVDGPWALAAVVCWAVAVIAFGAHAWPRIKAFGR